MTSLSDEVLRHDRVHEPVDDRRWRESYYFSFFDTRHGIGGFSSIGRRPASGRTGSINVIWGPDIPTLVASEFDMFEVHDDAYAAAGLTYRAEEPFGRWRVAFSGPLNVGGIGVECDHAALGPAAKSETPKARVDFDLTFAPSYPPYLYRERPEWQELFTGHVDEIGAVRGTLAIDGREYAIDGRGAKDHSWGVRDWFKPYAWRWLDLLTESAAPEVALWRASLQPDRWVDDGAVYAAGGTAALTGYRETVETQPRERKPRPGALRAEVESDGGRVGFSGRVVRVLPVLFARGDDSERLVSWNDRALLECTYDDGSAGWANVEFENLVRERQP
ncbi:MAG: hypothetical protein GEV03_06570 [Streptosporangiales bacterium]|nr:hypothetical protein [Streptosporangiales bacterium]